MPLSEDQVRDQARNILKFHNDDQAFSDTGQLTSFNVLGKNFKPNPWKGDTFDVVVNNDQMTLTKSKDNK